MTNDEVKAAVESYFAATQRMDAKGWVDHFAVDAVSHDPVGGTPLRGHEELLAFFAQIAGAFTSVGLFADSIFPVPNGAAAKWTGRGVGKNGRSVTFEGVDVFEFDGNGKIRILWAYWNPAAMMANLA